MVCDIEKDIVGVIVGDLVYDSADISDSDS